MSSTRGRAVHSNSIDVNTARENQRGTDPQVPSSHSPRLCKGVAPQDNCVTTEPFAEDGAPIPRSFSVTLSFERKFYVRPVPSHSTDESLYVGPEGGYSLALNFSGVFSSVASFILTAPRVLPVRSCFGVYCAVLVVRYQLISSPLLSHSGQFLAYFTEL
ncbi:hypothetical protein BDQ17DRAFT_1355458 [Cyathus striatus]|nr:hypothetical protein BDQ17DRAFT_1355458 [Cyathus striatus]